jgi:hypothetical protein
MLAAPVVEVKGVTTKEPVAWTPAASTARSTAVPGGAPTGTEMDVLKEPFVPLVVVAV